jgi:hypothetical protein
MDTWTSRTTSKPPGAVPASCDRRTFLKGAALAVAGFSAAVPFQVLLPRPATAAQFLYSPDYGPLFPTLDENTDLELLSWPKASGRSRMVVSATVGVMAPHARGT